MLPAATLTVAAQKRKPAKRSKRPRRIRDGEGSPITVGGGGSVGIDFDENYYKLIPSIETYINGKGDTIHKLFVIDKHGRITDCALPQANCTITIHSKKGNDDSAIQIFGDPLGVKFAGAEYVLEDPEDPTGGTGKKIHHNKDRKITGIDILDNSHPNIPPTPVNVPADGKCTIIAVNEKL